MKTFKIVRWLLGGIILKEQVYIVKIKHGDAIFGENYVAVLSGSFCKKTWAWCSALKRRIKSCNIAF